MPKIYHRNCDFCGLDYTGRGNYFCSVACDNASRQSPILGMPFVEDEKYSKKEITKTQWREFFDNINVMKEAQLAEKTSVSYAKINLDVEQPIILTFSGCWHVGSRGTDYKLLREYIELILDTDNVYLCLLGDEIENFFKFYTQEANEQQIVPPGIQRKLFTKIINELREKNKLLFSVWSNHVGQREEKLLGYSPTEELFRGVTFFDGKGTLDLTVGEELYKLFVVHKTRTTSVDNPCLGMKTELKRYSMYDRYDIVASAHLHYPYLSVEYMPEKTIFLKAGTFKTDDLYARRNWREGIVGAPAIILYPNEHKTIAFENLKSAIEYNI